MKKKLNIMVLFDMSSPPPADENFAQFRNDEWETEWDVVGTLQEMKHSVRHVPIFDDLAPLRDEIKKERPDVIFNLAESYRNERRHEAHVAAHLELLGIPYTGAGPTGLMLSKNKGLTKEILSFHRIRVPRFVVSHSHQPIRRLRRFTYPAFVKPLGLEASDGISQDSFSDNEEECLSRVAFIHEKLSRSAIIEEYIEGRELYVAVLGNNRPRVFSPRELHFTRVPEGTPKFATYQAKWNLAYRKRWGIRSGPAKAIDPMIKKKIDQVCRRTYRALQLNGYARIDLRLTEEGKVYVLEANPNPTLAESEDFAKAAAAAKMEYRDLIKKILSLSLP